MQALTNMIHLYDKYYLSADSIQFIVSEKNIYEKGNNIGETYFSNNKYFPKLNLLFEYLLESILKRELSEKSEEAAETLQEMKEKQEQFIEDLLEVSEKVGSTRHLLEEIKE
jgi:hypothetical protein